MVSALVVKTLTFSFEFSTLNSMSKPSDLPIQLRCCSFKEDVNQWCLIRLIIVVHKRIFLNSIASFLFVQLGILLSETPSLTSSLAKTVPNSGHQLTWLSDKKAKR